MVRSGRLRHYATLKLPSTQQGSRGRRSGADTTVLSDVPVEIMPLSGRELEIARASFPAATHAIRLWADPDTPLNTKHYLVANGKTFDVGYVNNVDEIGLEYELICQERPT